MISGLKDEFQCISQKISQLPFDYPTFDKKKIEFIEKKQKEDALILADIQKNVVVFQQELIQEKLNPLNERIRNKFFENENVFFGEPKLFVVSGNLSS